MTQIHKGNLPLSILVPLIFDDYDYNDDPNTISATSLIKPLKQLILAERASDVGIVDAEQYIPTFLGNAVHNQIENAWRNVNEETLEQLGYSFNNLVGKVVIEERYYKEILEFTVSGKVDMIIDGHLTDFKTGSVYGYINQSNKEKHVLQGSIYRWLAPELIKDDFMSIVHIFTDYSKAQSYTKDYPESKIVESIYPLLSLKETEHYIKTKIRNYIKYKDSPEEDIPRCTDKELWREETKYKYYANPDKMTRATKVFDTLSEASMHRVDRGKGIVKEVPGKVKACRYCAGFDLCKQKDEYIREDLL